MLQLLTKMATLLCSPTPRIIWTRLARPLNERSSMPADEFGQELVIRDVQLEDSGHYQCSASNTLGKPVTHVFTLTVQCQCWFRLYFRYSATRLFLDFCSLTFELAFVIVVNAYSRRGPHRCSRMSTTNGATPKISWWALVVLCSWFNHVEDGDDVYGKHLEVYLKTGWHTLAGWNHSIYIL